MSRSKTHGSEIQFLTAEIKRLKKKLKQYEREYKSDSKDESVVEECEEEYKEYLCPKCEEGTISILDLEFKAFEICKVCGYRKLIRG